MSRLSDPLPHARSALIDATRRTISAGAPELDAAPDAALIGVCERFLRAEAEYRRRVDAGEVEWEDSDLDRFRMDEYYPAAEAVCAMPARTLAGVRAKAEAAFAFYDPDPPDRGSLMADALWEVLCWLAGKPCVVPELAPDQDMPVDGHQIASPEPVPSVSGAGLSGGGSRRPEMAV